MSAMGIICSPGLTHIIGPSSLSVGLCSLRLEKVPHGKVRCMRTGWHFRITKLLRPHTAFIDCWQYFHISYLTSWDVDNIIITHWSAEEDDEVNIVLLHFFLFSKHCPSANAAKGSTYCRHVANHGQRCPDCWLMWLRDWPWRILKKSNGRLIFNHFVKWIAPVITAQRSYF